MTDGIIYTLVVLVIGLAGLIVALYRRNRSISHQNQEIEAQLHQTEKQAADTSHRLDANLDAIRQINQKYSEASSEGELIKLVMRLSTELTGAAGASFVPLDEHGQPYTIMRFGKPSDQVPDAWIEFLASPASHERCNICDQHDRLVNPCPLLTGPFARAEAAFCLPIRRGKRQLGVMNLFIDHRTHFDEKSRSFLHTLIDETAIVLESIRTRQRERDMLEQIQNMQGKSELTTGLNSLLENLRLALEADFALLTLSAAYTQPLLIEQFSETLAGQENCDQVVLSSGRLPEGSEPALLARMQRLSSSNGDQLPGASDPTGYPSGVKSTLAVVVNSREQQPSGALLVGSEREAAFLPNQAALLKSVAGYITILVENSRRRAELEYHVMIEERTRLAREIHDGLAQTIGFLKLQAAQAKSFLEKGDLQRVERILDVSYGALTDAYADARYAIDGLRLFPSESGVAGWLPQIVSDFEASFSEGPVPQPHLTLETKASLPGEVQSQLIRILQEALSNIRKHARAQNVWISFVDDVESMVLTIRDDGQGFFPGDIAAPSQHGLRGMRERAELIGAELQVNSQPGLGTTMRLCLPVKGGEHI